MTDRFSIHCTQCSKEFRVDDRLIGKRIQCKKCGAVFTIARPEPVRTPPPISQPARVASASLSKQMWLIGGAIGVVALMVGAVAVFLFGSKTSSAPTATNPLIANNTPPTAPPIVVDPVRRQKTADNLHVIFAALQQYHDEHGIYPKRLEDLTFPATSLDAVRHSPYGPKADGPDYQYFPLPLPHLKPGFETILVIDSAEGPVENGVTVLRGDGTVQFVTAGNLHAVMMSSVQYATDQVTNPPPAPATGVKPPALVQPPATTPTAVPAGPSENPPAGAWLAAADPVASPPITDSEFDKKLPGQLQVYSPFGPSRYIVVHDGTHQASPNMQVWDVETGKCLYRFDVSDDMGNYVLSPDGQHVAMRLYDRSTEHITYSVVDARTGRQKMITGPAPNAKTPAFPLAFTSDGQLLTVDTCIDLSDVEQGRRIRQMGDDLQRLDRDQFAASANGKLAAWLSPQGNTVRLFETATGKMLGASPLPDAGDRASESENLVDNLAFSPDGRELAALVGGRHIYVWSIDSGRLVADFPIAPRARNWNPSDLSAILQWLPDSQAWLIADDQIVDRLSGKAICMLPDLRDERGLETGERRMLDRSHVLVEFCVNPPEHATVLKSFPLDVDQLEKARAAMPGFK